MTTQPTATAQVTDVVLEGGGVKGIGLVGALLALGEQGWSFARVGGTSAGAIVGSVLAALQARGEPVSRLEDVVRSLDFKRFPDRGFPGRYLGPLGFVADGLSVLLEDGAYEGDYLRRWLSGVLKDLGVETFGDLRTDDPGDDGSIASRYRLAVVASDVSRHRLVQLPWHYPDYGVDPDEQRVADAVRASASIPYFFEPVTLRGPLGESTLVDGGLVSNYPLSMFDRTDGKPARWPTVGVRLDPFGTDMSTPATKVSGVVELGAALVQTAIEGCQAKHVLEPCNLERSIAVDTAGVSATDFGITPAQRDGLVRAGRTAARTFLASWDYPGWVSRCGPTG